MSLLAHPHERPWTSERQYDTYFTLHILIYIFISIKESRKNVENLNLTMMNLQLVGIV